MKAPFDSTNDSSVTNSLAEPNINANQINENDARKPGSGVKLIDVSWLVGNLYLEDTDREKLILGAPGK